MIIVPFYCNKLKLDEWIQIAEPAFIMSSDCLELFVKYICNFSYQMNHKYI